MKMIYTEIKNNMGLLTPLKPIVNPKNKKEKNSTKSKNIYTPRR